MAYGGGDTRKCYNGPKSWYLGWYNEFHQVLDPVTTPSKLVEIVGLADYDEAMSSGDPNSQAVVLKIDTYANNALCELLISCAETYIIHVVELHLTTAPT